MTAATIVFCGVIMFGLFLVDFIIARGNTWLYMSSLNWIMFGVFCGLLLAASFSGQEMFTAILAGPAQVVAIVMVVAFFWPRRKAKRTE